jgi:hypothetical protein
MNLLAKKLSTPPMQPVIDSLFSVCKNYLAMEKENKRLAAELAEVHRKCFFHIYC